MKTTALLVLATVFASVAAADVKLADLLSVEAAATVEAEASRGWGTMILGGLNVAGDVLDTVDVAMNGYALAENGANYVDRATSNTASSKHRRRRRWHWHHPHRHSPHHHFIEPQCGCKQLKDVCKNNRFGFNIIPKDVFAVPQKKHFHIVLQDEEKNMTENDIRAHMGWYHSGEEYHSYNKRYYGFTCQLLQVEGDQYDYDVYSNPVVRTEKAECYQPDFWLNSVGCFPDPYSQKHLVAPVKTDPGCKSSMAGGSRSHGVKSYEQCLKCATRWAPGYHGRTINCQNLWGLDED